MVARLRISPADGIKMSPPGIDVNAAAERKLLDPRFSNLQLHQRGEGIISNDVFRGENHWTWEVVINFPALTGVPIVFVNTKYAGQNYVDFPASMIPTTTVQGPSNSFSYPNYFVATESTLTINMTTKSPADGGQAPYYKYQIYKNLRAS